MVVLLISLYYQKSLRRYGLNCSIVYINEMFQCRLCEKTLDTKTKYKNHAIKVNPNASRNVTTPTLLVLSTFLEIVLLFSK